MKELGSQAGAASFNNREVFSQQNSWIKEGGTGCIYSQVLAARKESGRVKWTNIVEEATSEDLVHTAKGKRLIDTVNTSITQGKDELFSTIFPSVTTPDSLAELVTYLSNRPPFYIDNVITGKVRADDPDNYNGISLRLALPNNAESWALMLGPYDFFSPSRRAPHTQLIFRPTPVKANLTTPEHQIGIDDAELSLTPRTFMHLLHNTEKKVAKTRGDYSQKLFRARVAVVVPQQSWEKAQTKFGRQG